MPPPGVTPGARARGRQCIYVDTFDGGYLKDEFFGVLRVEDPYEQRQAEGEDAGGGQEQFAGESEPGGKAIGDDRGP